MDRKCQSMHFEEKNLLLLPGFKPWIIQPITCYPHSLSPSVNNFALFCVRIHSEGHVPTRHTKNMVHQETLTLNAT
jgi:hypothetical protein